MRQKPAQSARHAARSRASRTMTETRVPRYVLVASALRNRIRDGHWPLGSRIATLQHLEREFSVARVTVRQAIELLQSEGLVRSHQGKGTFVTGTPAGERWLQLATDWTSLIRPIKDNVLEPLPVTPVPEPSIEPDDGLPHPGGYTFLKSLQRRDGEPYALARVHVATDVYQRKPQSFQKRVALGVIAGMPGLDVARAHQTLTIGAADIETAQLLAITLNAPTAEARCVVTDRSGRVLYLGEITYRGDCVKLNIELLGPDGTLGD